MKKITGNTIIRKNIELLESDIDGEKVMMSLESGDYFGLDNIGTRIWQLIDNQINISELVGILMEEYDVNKEKCTDDVLKFLNELYENKLIRII